VLRRAMNRQARAAVGDRLELAAHAARALCKYLFPASHFAQSLLLLAFLADDPFLGVLDAFALVGFRSAVFADFRGNLTDLLLVDAGHDDLRRLRNGDRNALRGLVNHIMAETERKLQVLALQGRAISNAVDLELALVTDVDALQDVFDHRPGHTPLGAGVL